MFKVSTSGQPSFLRRLSFQKKSKKPLHESINTKADLEVDPYHFKCADRWIHIWACIRDPAGCVCSQMDIFSCGCDLRILDVERAVVKKNVPEKTRDSFFKKKLPDNCKINSFDLLVPFLQYNLAIAAMTP